MEETYPFELRNISKTFGAVKALKNVSLSVRANEVLGLIGENGAGKSTLLKILSGSYQPDEGTILIDGKARSVDSPSAAAAAGIAVVHQEQSLVTNLTVGENILMSMRSARAASSKTSVRSGVYNWKRINEEAARVLGRIRSKIDPRKRVDELSFADRQMVEIAKALQISEQPGLKPVIVLDEPTSVLEDNDIQQLEEEVVRLKEMGSVIFVSHRLDEIIRVCDRICVLRHGEVVGERLTKDVDQDELFRLMTGRTSEHKTHERKSKDGNPVVLEVENLERRHAFRNISFTVRSGEVHAFLGTNNSGREEVCRAVFGAEPFDAGRVSYKGTSGGRPKLRSNVYDGMAYLPSERKFEGMVAGMTVAENITLTHPGESALGPILRGSGRRKIAESWIEKLSIRPPRPDAEIGALSGGNQQKAVLAKWLSDPSLTLLILDHPTRGIDPGAREDVASQIRHACEGGACVLMIADTLEEALGIADTITVMRDGEITATYDLCSGTIPSHAELVGKMI
ncbi:sugar ABC transporter ATP-binding protein [Paraburkholderia phenoliruptrix]|uniref:sugar ABC transporter ATP-binding protein n=1 Tax=Paraburkholderia phenoliruptrix TaxID=252970 RepID=UPI002869B2C6|nr:sugar ABC transporter ATP-binding protein [Paraburkholderia phenoliruptrix]WMY11803.1 sugar ABC transporter ATP-binding protein [Paraburkholderia phenoliruptrix]